ncbi:MAG: 13E12 repeat family protein, partial [Actinomycetota bacterium]|nr:13E12 repeat family protein [Actinomycetota bacterium]
MAVVEDVVRVVDPGEWLVAHRWEMDRGESSWLEALAGFDRDLGWAADGQLSCAEWLMWRTNMARATAFEKVRIARQLRARPAVAEAFADGRLSYS